MDACVLSTVPRVCDQRRGTSDQHTAARASGTSAPASLVERRPRRVTVFGRHCAKRCLASLRAQHRCCLLVHNGYFNYAYSRVLHCSTALYLVPVMDQPARIPTAALHLQQLPHTILSLLSDLAQLHVGCTHRHTVSFPPAWIVHCAARHWHLSEIPRTPHVVIL